MGLASCTCCEDDGGDCPHNQFITIAKWNGPNVVPNSLRYASNSPFAISFTFDGITETTGVLGGSITADVLQTALELLSNIGIGVLVTSDPEGRRLYDTDFTIEFLSTATFGQELPLLVIDESVASVSMPSNWEVLLLQPGAPGVAAKQLLRRKRGVWESLNLDRYKTSNWQWRVVVLGTGNVPAGTKLNLAQSQREYRQWIAPISDIPPAASFELKFGGMQWSDSVESGEVIGGTFTLTLEADTVFTTAPLDWNASNELIYSALSLLPNSPSAGTIEVAGGPLPFAPVAITFSDPLTAINLRGNTSLVGSVPPVNVSTQANGNKFPPPGGPENELQVLDYAWPAHGGYFRIRVHANGSTKTTRIIPYNATAVQIQAALVALKNLDTPPNGDIKVSSSFGVPPTEVGYDPAGIIHTRYQLEFLNSLTFTNVDAVETISSLSSQPTVVVTRLGSGDDSAFRAEFEPLNVGMVWNGCLRNAFGNVDDRDLRHVSIFPTINLTGTYPNQVAIEEQPPGYGVLAWGGCTGERQYTGIRGLGSYTIAASAMFVRESGEIRVIGNLEFALQIRCLPCHYSPEFNLWGMYESSQLGFYRIWDALEPDLYTPHNGFACYEPPGPGVCRRWELRFNNVPYRLRQKFGPDGYDGHLINDVFFAEGSMKARKPPCSPNVVLLGDGYWLEEQLYEWAGRWAALPRPLPPNAPPGTKPSGCVLSNLCDQKPKEESLIEHPTSALSRLKLIYGSDFSYWGGWIDLPHSSQYENLIRCRFDEYDLADVKVLILGGLPVGPHF
ncbi:MAG: hypothetical protein ACKO0Z_18160, partial [Betaproteobacteria bacterium]